MKLDNLKISRTNLAPKTGLVKTMILAMAISLPLMLLQLYFYMRLEEPVYIWDFKSYWIIWEHFSQLITTDPRQWFAKIRTSVDQDDYNPLPIALLFPFYYLPFASRTTYIASVSVCYLLPSILLFVAVFYQFAAYRARSSIVFVTLIAVSYAPFWKPTLRGYPNIVGLLPILVIVLLLMRRDLGKKLSVRWIITTGFLLWVPFVLRRWYAYTIISLYLTLPFLNFLLFNDLQNRKFFRLKNIFLHFAVAGVVSALFALMFQKDLILRVLNTNYNSIYSAYQNGFVASLHSLLNDPGYYILPFFALGIIACLTKGRTPEKIFGLFCFSNLLVSFTLFTRTQSPGLHHCLPFELWILFVSVLGFHWLVWFIRRPGAQNAIMVLGALCSLLIGILTFNPISFAKAFGGSLLPQKNYPLRVQNFQNYQKLTRVLEQLTAGGEMVAVLSSNSNLCDDLISTLSGGKIDPYLVHSSQVDLIDRLNLAVFSTRYIVVADPIQLHLKPSGQRVISIPAKDLLSHTGIGAAYVMLPTEYPLADNITAKIYEKTRPFTPQEVQTFFKQFSDVYPDWRPIYFDGLAIPYLTATITPGDIWGEFSLLPNDVIYAHPGEHIPTNVQWYFGNLRKLRIASINTTCTNPGGILVTFRSPGLVSQTHLDNGTSRIVDLSGFAHQMGSVSIAKDVSSSCDLISITAE